MALKIIHTADWHLGQTFFGYDREEEHDAFLSWLINTLTEQQADVLLIAGDVFDVSNPSASAQRRFFHFLKEVTSRNPSLQIIVIAGNHDSAARLEAPSPLLEELNTYVIGVVKRTGTGEIDFDNLLLPLHDKEGMIQAWCMAVPFLRQGDYPVSPDISDTYTGGVDRMYTQLYSYASERKQPGQALIAMGHLHASGAELSENDRSERVIMGGLESVSADTFNKGITYTALGHIHKAQRIGGRDNLRYSGSPLPMSFSEKNYHHQLLCIELEGEDILRIEPIQIPQKVSLLCIPVQPASPSDVLEALDALPEKSEGASLAPFLEVRVLFAEPEPSFRHQVEEVLKNKQVRLTSVIPSYPRKEDKELLPLTYNDLQKIDPLDMLKRAFTGKYHSEMPDEMQSLFIEVMQELNLKPENK